MRTRITRVTMSAERAAPGCLLAFLLLAVVIVVPFVRHIVWCVQHAAETGSAIALLIVGLVIPPVGWLHGLSVLLGLGGWV